MEREIINVSKNGLIIETNNISQKIVCFLTTAYFCCILILQESSTGQSINREISKYNYLLFLWIIAIAIFFKPTVTTGKISKYFSSLIIMYFIVFTIPTLFAITDDSSFLSTFFWSTFSYSTPLISAYLFSLFVSKKNYNQIQLLVDFVLYSAIVALLPKLLSSNILVVIFNIENILSGSNFTTESDVLGFVFGILSINYLLKRKYIKLIISLIFVLITCKRIVFLAVLATVLLNNSYFKRLTYSNKFIFIIIAITINLLVAYSTLMIGDSNSLVSETLSQLSGKTINELTAGRNILYSNLENLFGYPQAFGNGYGRVYDKLNHVLGNEELIHSDILKHLYEIGAVGFILWIAFWYNLALKSFNCLLLTICMNIFFATDNVFTYFAVNFTFYLVTISFLTEEIDKQNIPLPKRNKSHYRNPKKNIIYSL